MKPAVRWERVQDLFHLAIGRRDQSLRPFLDSIRAEDPGLGDEVASLLEAHVRTGPVRRLDSEVPVPGGQVGPYRLLGALGMGGMGIVYRAERVTPDFVQRVALKLLPSGCNDLQLEARMAQERKVLAELEHPGIARLIDGGTTAGGQSFIAMEYVEGKPLADFARDLPIKQRLRLVLDVCDALEFAHQHLVVHGDLKPGNILVTPDGHPKLLDFGLSARLEADSGQGPAGESWLTPAYASPEQIRGQRITTATDIYALGVLLYELVSGVRPYETSGLSSEQLAKRICEHQPQPPSTRVSGRTHRALRGDLDAIVLKALAKDPAQRYASVYRLAEDLRRHLLDLPIGVRPQTRRYRLYKYALRNRAFLSTSALIGAALIAGWLALAKVVEERQERRVAVQVAEEAEEVTTLLIDLIQANDPQRGTGDVDAPTLALLHFELAKAEELSKQPVVQARLFDALGLVFLSVGEHELASNLLQRTLDRRLEVHGEKHPDVAESLEHLAQAMGAKGDFNAALALYDRALDVERALFGGNDPRVARTMIGLGELLPHLGLLREGEQVLREALEIRRKQLRPDDPLIASNRLAIAEVLEEQGDFASAEGLIREVLADRRRVLGADHPEVGSILVVLARVVAERPLGMNEAERLVREGLEIQTRTLGADNLQRGPGLVLHAHLLAVRGRHAEAERLLREAVELRTRILGPHSAEVAATMDELADVLEAQGRASEAEAIRRETLANRKLGLGNRHPALGTSLSALASTAAAQGDWVAAESLAREALELREGAHGRRHPLVARSLAQLAQIRVQRGAVAESEKMLLEAREILARQLRPDHAELSRIDAQLRELRARGN